MIRTSITGFVASVVLAVGVLMSPNPAKALSKEEILRRCAESIKEEFGEAEVKFNKFRRNGNKEMAFGRLEMTDGTTRQVRCRIRRGRGVDVRFPSGSNAGGNEAWTATRPENAGFIEPKEEEKPAEPTAGETGDDQATQEPQNAGGDQQDTRTAAKPADQGDDQAGAQAGAQGGDQTNNQGGAQGGDQTGDKTSATKPDDTNDQAPSGDGQTAQSQDGAGNKPEEKKRSGPVFRRVDSN